MCAGWLEGSMLFLLFAVGRVLARRRRARFGCAVRGAPSDAAAVSELGSAAASLAPTQSVAVMSTMAAVTPIPFVPFDRER